MSDSIEDYSAHTPHLSVPTQSGRAPQEADTPRITKNDGQADSKIARPVPLFDFRQTSIPPATEPAARKPLAGAVIDKLPSGASPSTPTTKKPLFDFRKK